jgi:hypothetical protein
MVSHMYLPSKQPEKITIAPLNFADIEHVE